MIIIEIFKAFQDYNKKLSFFANNEDIKSVYESPNYVDT